MLGGAALLASGALLDLTLRHGFLSVAGLHLFAAADWLAPGLSDTRAVALATSFAFLQSVHYAIWLVAIPAGDCPGDGSRTWRAGFRDLARDLTPAGLGAAAGLTLLVAGMGLLFAAGTRRLFLSLGTFHGWLELAVLAFVLARGRVAGRRARPRISRDLLGRELAARVRGDRAHRAGRRRSRYSPTVERSLGRRVGAVIAANLATHPLVWFLFPGLAVGHWTQFGLSEAWAFLAELAIYRLVWPALRPRRAVLVSLAANAASCLFGLLMMK